MKMSTRTLLAQTVVDGYPRLITVEDLQDLVRVFLLCQILQKLFLRRLVRVRHFGLGFCLRGNQEPLTVVTPRDVAQIIAWAVDGRTEIYRNERKAK